MKDSFSNFFKILILISSLFILNSSRNFITAKKINKFEYPIIILISILGMFFMLSSNDIILFYLGLELQSLALYILASIGQRRIQDLQSRNKIFCIKCFVLRIIIVWLFIIIADSQVQQISI